jgi:ubiquinone/menaquinone biosynthesis C-methylase UbiE/GNAT superfamily N-acetyltransferase
MESPAGRRSAIREHLGRTGRLLREQGALALGAHLMRRVGHFLVEIGSVTFFERDLSAEVVARPSPGIRVRQLQPSDRESLLHGSESPWEELMARFHAGDLCFGAVDPLGRAVHTRWLTFTGARIPELGLDFVPSPDAAYFYDGYTRPDARRRGIDAVVRDAIFDVLRERGRRRVYSYVRDDNPDGLRAAGRCQRAVGAVRSVRLLGSGPFVLGMLAPPLSTLLRRRPGRDEATRRAAEWRGWFEGWLGQPLARRSIGCHELPRADLEAMAAHISSTLGLEPSSDLVLDVGCDSAMVSRHVAARCAGLVGVDFIPGMLVDARRREEGEAPPNLRCAAADGRHLPFPAGTFAKAYCSGVIHTLPTREDGIAMILELTRVSKPGGLVLVAAVPDSKKRWRARREAFRLGRLRERVRIAVVAVLPETLRRFFRRIAPWLPPAPLRYLEYDLAEIGARLAGRGLACQILDYPPDFRSRDFRETRSSLLIAVPPPFRADGLSQFYKSPPGPEPALPGRARGGHSSRKGQGAAGHPTEATRPGRRIALRDS